MNGFNTDKIEQILANVDNISDEEVSKDVFGVIYSLGRDCGNEVEYQYSYRILMDLCKSRSRHVRAYSILGLSLMVWKCNEIINKDEIISIIGHELKYADALSRKTILTAVEDFNSCWKCKIL